MHALKMKGAARRRWSGCDSIKTLDKKDRVRRARHGEKKREFATATHIITRKATIYSTLLLSKQSFEFSLKLWDNKKPPRIHSCRKCARPTYTVHDECEECGSAANELMRLSPVCMCFISITPKTQQMLAVTAAWRVKRIGRIFRQKILIKS